MKIAFIGKMASGKTTCCNYLQSLDPSFKITNFAKMVKYIANNIFFMKNKDRVLLQQIGTKLREIRPSVFIDYVIHETSDSNNYLLDDARYVNEIMTLKENGWYLIKLIISKELQEQRIKKTYPDTYQKHLQRLTHISETQQDTLSLDIFDYVLKIDKIKDIKSLYNELKNIKIK